MICPNNLKHPGQEALLVEENAMVRKMARIGSRHARMVFFKANMSEFNSLLNGCNGLCLQARVSPGMSEMCASAISF